MGLVKNWWWGCEKLSWLTTQEVSGSETVSILPHFCCLSREQRKVASPVSWQEIVGTFKSS